MRLKSVSISNYKNLKDFSLTFDGDGFIDIFVGKNGSGKSNFLEALIMIFEHAHSDASRSSGPKFDYAISWEIGRAEVLVEWQNGKRFINGKTRVGLRKEQLPSNIIIYYSGQNTTVSELVKKHRARYLRKIKNAPLVESPYFFGIGPEYKALLLSIMLMLPETEMARRFLIDKLGIEHCGETVILTLKRPTIVPKNKEFEPFDDRQIFWGSNGLVREFLDKLMSCIPGDFTRGSLYDRRTDTYTLGLNVERFRQVFSSPDRAQLFSEFNALHTLGMIKDIAMPIHLNANTQVSSRAFSDGQFQSVYVFAISEIFKNRNCITLLDEPDAFLHPEWQFDFLKQTHAISEAAAKSNHILMSSHSAATLISDNSKKVRYFDLKEGVANCYSLPKRIAVEKLSSNIIRYSEQEQLLSMINAIQIENKPVFFTEGTTGIPVCILVLKKCKKPDDVLFINAAEHFVKGKRQNQLGDGENGTPDHIGKIVSTYQFRKEEERYSKRVSMERIAEEGYNLNISRYISTATADVEIVLESENANLVEIEEKIKKAKDAHNVFLRELGKPLLP